MATEALASIPHQLNPLASFFVGREIQRVKNGAQVRVVGRKL
jgi:hypothetical protein